MRNQVFKYRLKVKRALKILYNYIMLLQKKFKQKFLFSFKHFRNFDSEKRRILFGLSTIALVIFYQIKFAHAQNNFETASEF